MAESELERAEKRLTQMKARVQALRSREATKQRKLDTQAQGHPRRRSHGPRGAG